MHILRSHHLPGYFTLVRSPYTTDPYPSTDWTAPPRREAKLLDLYIAISTRAEVELWESSLLMSVDGFEDLFALYQPQARLEDLVIERGGKKGVIHSMGREKWQGIVAEDVKVDLRFKSAALRLVTTTPTRALRSVSEVSRMKGETLEITARHIVDALCQLALLRHEDATGRSYRILS
ncbi:hypothetical protein CBS101457_004803 [Exobasidium rhododendri]|nr:hypothetical protein CBS101457_004803 [Exobasidium rhododendri]